MPNKPLADKTQCRYCKQKSPIVEIRHIKGLPIGECRACNRDRQQASRLNKNFHLDFYSCQPELVRANCKMLASLQPGAYTLYDRPTKTRVGYIACRPGIVLVNLWNDITLFKSDLFGIASYLGNQNVFLSSERLPIVDLSGTPIELDDIGKGLQAFDVQEKLIWYDTALLAKAVKLVKAEITQSKRNNMAIARRSNNSKPKPSDN